MTMADALYLLCETRRSPSSSSQRCARHEEIKQRIRSVPSSLTLNVSDSAFLMIGTKRLSQGITYSTLAWKNQEILLSQRLLRTPRSKYDEGDEEGIRSEQIIYCNIVLWR